MISIVGFVSLNGCVGTQTNQQRAIEATAQIGDPIRTLEARAELEIQQPWNRASDELLRQIIPDAIKQLSPGSSAYQRALLGEDEMPPQPHTIQVDTSLATLDPIDPRRKTQAIKLFARARQLRQRGQSKEAIDALNKAARLDPRSGAVQRSLGDALLASNDRVGALKAYRRAVELGDRSPQALVHLAGDASARDDQALVISLTREALDEPTIGRFELIESIARVLLGTGEINSGYLKAGAQTLGDALGSFDVRSRDLQWKREIIQILSQRNQLWILTGDAWGSVGAHRRAQEAYANAGNGVEHPPVALVARQIASALRQGHPASAALLLLDHLQQSASDLGSQEREWTRALASIDGLGDVLGPAIGALNNRPGLTPAIRRSLLGIEENALDVEHGIALLANAGSDANDPLVCLSLFLRIHDEQKRIAAAETILESNPEIARAIGSGLTRTLMSPAGFVRSNANPASPSAQLLVASLALGLGRADLIGYLDSIAENDLTTKSTPWLAAHAQACALTGRWPLTDSMISALRFRSELDAPDATRALISTLLIAQQPTESWELAKELVDDADASIDDLMLGAQIAQNLRDYSSSANLLERAVEHDPYNEKIYEQLYLLRSSSSPIGDADELARIVRQLGAARPRSALYGLIRVNELARNGLIDEAQSVLVELNTNEPYREIGYDLLLSIWKTKQTQGQSQALIEGISWLEARLESDPNSVEIMLTIARGLLELEAHTRSLDLLEAGYDRTGSFEIARAIEQLLVGPLERSDDARAHVIDRLSKLDGIDPVIEYANELSKKQDSGSVSQAAKLLAAHIPPGIEFLPAQRAGLDQIIFNIAGSSDALHTERSVLDTISLVESHSKKLGFQLSRIKVILLAQQPKLDMDGLIDAVLSAVSNEENEDNRSTLRTLPIQSLVSEDRPHEAIVFSTRLATLDGSLDPDEIITTFQLLASVGTNADMIGVLDTLESNAMMDEVIKLTTDRFGTPARDTPATTSDQRRAELAYTAAAITTAFERPEQASSYYELALSYNPDHAWANNDYGYMLAENGERMEQAVEMLEKAAELMPNEASVIDSLAWVRYKLGIFDNIKADDGSITTRGSIALLMRANELDTKRENATIQIHLGDALWRGGYQDRAIDAWLVGEDIMRSRLRLIKVQPNPNPRAIEAFNAQLNEIRTRLQDAETSKKPHISPLVEENKSKGD